MDGLLKPKQVAELLQIPEKAVHRLCREGKLQWVPMDKKGTRRFTQDQVQEFIRSQSTFNPRQRSKVDKAPTARISSPTNCAVTAIA